MSNERNVAALKALVQEAMGLTDEDYNYGAGPSAVAAFLAARGVLVPASLSDEEWFRVVAGDEGNRDECVAALERIARGEP
jgi:hypothetical protein